MALIVKAKIVIKLCITSQSMFPHHQAIREESVSYLFPQIIAGEISQDSKTSNAL